ncbi:hypothetical protein [Burkholderia multivorans]|nr:hypothetical protein [Burkholderia multivorans]MDN8082116.1 hypothetical protein [Burkholderia multivorans]
MSVEPYENCFFIGGRGLAAKRFQTIDRTRRAKNPRFKTREFLMPFLGHFRLTETGKNPLKHRIMETDSGQRGGKSEQL